LFNNLIQKLFQSKTIKNFLIYGFGQGINILSPLLITPFLIYVCGLEKLGMIAIGQSLAYILNVIVDYSSFIIGVKETTINRHNTTHLEKIFITNYAAKVVLLMVVILFVAVLVFFVPFFKAIGLMIIYSTTIIIAQLVNPTWFLQGIENFKWITLINVLGKIIYFVGVFLCIQSVDDYIYANLWLGCGAIIANAIGFIWIVKKYQFSFATLKMKEVATLLQRDFTFCLSQLFFAIRNYSSVIIISYFAGDLIAGKFKVIEQIINFFRTYLQLFFKFSYSYVCFAMDKSSKAGLQLWRKFNGLNLSFTTVLLIMVGVFSFWVLTFFRVEPNHINQLENYLHIALVIPFLIGITLPLEQLLFSLNKNKEYIRTTIIMTCFNIVTMSLVMKFYSLKEAFILLIITEAILIAIYLRLLRPYFLKETK
jgi:O-antigen/teichoic acid export membrane protein